MSVDKEKLKSCIKDLLTGLIDLEVEEKIEVLNFMKTEATKYSPFNQEPVDCVLWLKNEAIKANDYNPNTVAAPEMELLALSILEDGYTQPIVTWQEDGDYEVIDGFHRHRVGSENLEVAARIQGYLPVVVANSCRVDRGDRIASTIRHNRARGKHRVTAMSDIVVELKKRNWSDKKIGMQLGMDPDEVLRLCQVSGLAEMFSDQGFSEAWEVDESEDLPSEN